VKKKDRRENERGRESRQEQSGLGKRLCLTERREKRGGRVVKRGKRYEGRRTEEERKMGMMMQKKRNKETRKKQERGEKKRGKK
jgi:hypothetical protein